MKAKLTILVLAIVSSALVFGCNDAAANPDIDPFTFAKLSERRGFDVVQLVGENVEQCNEFLITFIDNNSSSGIVFHPDLQRVVCIEIGNGEISIAYRSSINEPISYNNGLELFTVLTTG